MFSSLRHAAVPVVRAAAVAPVPVPIATAARVLFQQVAGAKRNADGAGIAEGKRMRFSQAAPVASQLPPEAYKWPGNYLPSNGRFETEIQDKYDLECMPRPIVDGDAATKAGIDLLAQRLASRAKIADDVTNTNEAEVLADAEQADAMWEGVQQYYRKAATEARQKRTIYRRYDLISHPTLTRGACQGDARLAAIRKTLASLGYTRSQHQKLFHEHFIKACLPMFVECTRVQSEMESNGMLMLCLYGVSISSIYGHEWPGACERVLRSLGINRVRPEVMLRGTPDSVLLVFLFDLGLLPLLPIGITPCVLRGMLHDIRALVGCEYCPEFGEEQIMHTTRLSELCRDRSKAVGGHAADDLVHIEAAPAFIDRFP